MAFRRPEPPVFTVEQSPSVSDSKEFERAELHKAIWRIANDLRGCVDGSEGAA